MGKEERRKQSEITEEEEKESHPVYLYTIQTLFVSKVVGNGGVWKEEFPPAFGLAAGRRKRSRR